MKPRVLARGKLNGLRRGFVLAFTLIERLVVISIVALLIGILIPSLGKAKKSALSLKCISQLRSNAAGWQYCANDNDDVSVPAQPGRFNEHERNLYDVGNGLH